MKKVIAFMAAILFVLSVFPYGAAAEKVDLQRRSTLALYYCYGEEAFSDLAIHTYRVAEVSENGEYSLTGVFKKYPVNIDGITSQTEWRRICTTLGAYIAADGIAPTATQNTDINGKAFFENLLPGMYLTLSVRVEQTEKITVFESFLTLIPYPEDNGDWLYDVTAYPKCEQHLPTPKELEYKVVKQWKDNSLTALRPDGITVDILKDGVLQTTEILSPENNWSYSWKAPDDGGKWQAVERDIPEYYTVSVEEFGTTIVITNVYEDNEKPPQTGDTTLPHVYILAMSLAGCGILLIAVWRKRSGI